MNRPKYGGLGVVVAFAVLITLGGVWGFALSARAQGEGGVKLTAQAGFDGYCKENAWFPVWVLVANSGPDLNGLVQISYKRDSDSAEAVLGEEVLLPTSSRKQLVFYAYPPRGGYEMDITLRVNNKIIAQTGIARSCLGADDLLFGVLADRPASYDIVKEADLTRGHAVVAHIGLSDLPDQAQGWFALDGLIVSGVDTSPLTDAQHNAMKLWLANGGKLMVVGGPDWQGAAAGFQDVVPVDINSTQTLENLPALQTYFQTLNAPQGTPAILAATKPHSRADALVAEAGLPLIVQKQVGFGRVSYFAADPSLAPLSGWDGMRSMYSNLLGAHAIRPEWLDIPWDTGASNQALGTLRELALPASIYLCGWMALYVLIIGPVNFLVLRRKKRSELAWLSIPGLVILFTVLAYIYGDVYRGSQPILNRIAVIQAWDGSEQAEVHALVGVYSPGRANYTLQASNPFLLYPFARDDSSSAMQDGQTSSMRDVRVDIGGMRVLAVDGSVRSLAISHNLVLTVADRDPVLRGSITNTSAYTLRGVMLVTPGDWTQLGDLPPGGSAKLNLSVSPSSGGPTFYALDPMNILNVLPYGPQANEDLQRRYAILRAVLASRSQGNWGIYLMGWLDRPMVPVSVKGRSFGAIDTSLYVDQLSPSIQYGSGTLQLTPGLLAWEASEAGRSPYSSNTYSTSGYVLSFRPAIPVHYRSVQKLSLYVDVSGGATPSQLQASLWDFKAQQWTPASNLSLGSNDIANPSNYVGPGAEVRLRIESHGGGYLGIQQSTITLLVSQ